VGGRLPDRRRGLDRPEVSQVTTDTSSALRFLEELPHETVNLVALEPDGEGIHAVTAPRGDARIAEFVDRHEGRWNLYWSIGEPRPDAPSSKLRKTDIARIHFVAADLDAGKGEDFETGRRRLQQEITGLLAHPIAPPTFVIDSGGGYQPFWRLAEPLPATTETMGAIEAQGRGIAAVLGGDATFDVNRIMRLPGTTNVPDAKKRARGRGEALAAVWARTGVDASPDDLAAAWAPLARRDKGTPTEADALGLDLAAVREFDRFDDLPEALRREFDALRRRRPDFADLWDTGVSPGVEDQSRSGQLYRLAGVLKGNGWDVNDYGRLAWVWSHGYGPDWATREDWRIARDLARAWGNWTGAEAALRGAPLPSEVFSVLPPEEAPSAAWAARRGPFVQPFVLGDPKAIPPRDWLYGDRYIRGYVAATIAPGGLGKSSLVMVEALAMATGRDLLGAAPKGRSRVLYLNGEDPADETIRRFTAACLHYGIDQSELDGYLFFGSGRDYRLTLMRQTGAGLAVVQEDVDLLRRKLEELEIDLAIFDPLVSMHEVPENDNGAVNAVCQLLGEIATEHECAIGLVHHVRKGAAGVQVETRVEDARGAGALLAATRVAHVANVMTQVEADKLGIPPGWRRRHFRIDSGKANMSPPAEVATWYKLHSVDLGQGDSVGVVGPWTPPVMRVGVSDAQAAHMLDAIEGGMNREHKGARWAVRAIAEAMGIDEADPQELTRAKAILRELITLGVLRRADVLDDQRRRKAGYEVARRPDAGELAFVNGEGEAE